MKFNIFTRRPVLAIVLSIVVLIVGALSVQQLAVEQYPDMAPPTVSVYTTYSGANAETVQKSVIVPLEEAINGVEGMNYITSSASNGGEASLMVYFKQGTDPDMAAVNVQNRVNSALSLLPAEVTRVGVTTEKQQNSELRTLALYSPNDKYDKKFLDNYMKINVEPLIKRIQGVGKVMSFGSSYSIRVWMNPDKMHQYKLVPSDITLALQQQNIEASTGSFGENHNNTFQYTMKYRGRFSTPEEFGNIVVKAEKGGQILRLRDVAKVELGDETYSYNSSLNGHPSSLIMVYQTAGSNAYQINNEIDATLAKVAENMPEGMEFATINDSNRFLKASINEVVMTLLEAMLLVILVVYVFLQDIRSTIIPAVSIIVSIVGTFAFMYIAGFTINLLTLFALVLAIGTVVDDAIIVVEAVQAKFDAGYTSSYLATNDAMKGISGAIFTSTLIFMAVFIPVSMMGGTSGMFYKEFGITMAVAVGLSALNAFTLSPALSALILKPYKNEDGTTRDNFAARFRKAFNAVFDVLADRYGRVLTRLIRHRWITASVVVVSGILLVVLIKNTRTGLVPDEDLGTMFVNVTAAPGTSLKETHEQMEQLNKDIAKIPEVKYSANVDGFSFMGSGSNSAMNMIALKPWEEREGDEHSSNAVIDRINALALKYPDLAIFTMAPPMIPGYGTGNSIDMHVQDHTGGDIDAFKQVVDEFTMALSKRKELSQVYSSFDNRYPQYWVDVDAARCQQSGISPSEVLETISGYYGGIYASNFNRFNKLYRVMIQASPEYRVTPESMNRIYVRIDGEMTPVSQFVHLTPTSGTQSLSRFNLFNAIPVSGMPASGYSTGDAIKAIQEVAEETLPNGYGYDFGGITREQAGSSSNMPLIMGISFLLVYLILSALYDSFLIPFAVILSVPMGLAGSFVFAQLFGLENNIYLQTGVVMLIGLLAKTAVLVTEYAVQRRKMGMSLSASAYYAAKIRLRPILMTVLCMVFGLLPLMVANGVGANGSRSLASGVVGGMIFGTIGLLVMVPVLYIAFQWMQEKTHFVEPKLIKK